MLQNRVIKINILKERYNEALLKETKITIKEKDSVMEELNIIQFKSNPDDVVHHCL